MMISCVDCRSTNDIEESTCLPPVACRKCNHLFPLDGGDMEKQIAAHAVTCNVTVKQKQEQSVSPPQPASGHARSTHTGDNFQDMTPNPRTNEGGGEAILLETIAEYKTAHPAHSFEQFLQSMWPEDYQIYTRSQNNHGSSKRSYKTWALAYSTYRPSSEASEKSVAATNGAYRQAQQELAVAEEEERVAGMRILGMDGNTKILPKKEDRIFYKREFENLYRQHDPDKLAGVDFILDGYEGQLDELLQLAKQSYGVDDYGEKENMQPGNANSARIGRGGVDATTLNAVASSIDQLDKLDGQYGSFGGLDDDDESDADTLLMQIGNLSAQIAQLKHQIRESTKSEPQDMRTKHGN